MAWTSKVRVKTSWTSSSASGVRGSPYGRERLGERRDLGGGSDVSVRARSWYDAWTHDG